ncbi:hypothetical protein Fmac_020548 [Flemingia macrophylla]|uniref:non-specific serine/threonine protein kinase n=1 Tax=Flemingia macrophylla TaxID=520843 RepID=A0ABD1LUB6_9FABA
MYQGISCMSNQCCTERSPRVVHLLYKEKKASDRPSIPILPLARLFLNPTLPSLLFDTTPSLLHICLCAMADSQLLQKDPTSRYARYDEILGKGAFKTVYKAFDEVDGIEVAWNMISFDNVAHTQQHKGNLFSEVHLLKSLKHENVIKLYNSWVDDSTGTINMITELFTSGSLRQYRKKHKNVDMKAIKNWARQILRGLCFLHSHSPPIIHRDLKCDNIFVNGNSGLVKIGDLGLATVMQQPTARSVIGTPEFMAPELYEEEYNELVDIYSFGMCILELVTCEYPYSECKNPAQIYKKVTSGIKPAALANVTDPEVKKFIEKCLVPATIRLSASELLKDPFLATENAKEVNHDTLLLPNPHTQLMNLTMCESRPMEIDSNSRRTSPGSSAERIEEASQISIFDLVKRTENNEFRLRGEKNAESTISLTLRIADAIGGARNIHFPFYIDSDTAISIAEEMVEHLELTHEDVSVIAELIHDMIVKLVPNWKPLSENLSSGTDHFYRPSEVQNGEQVNCHWPIRSSDYDMKTMYEDLVHSQPVDGDDQEKRESVMSDISAECGITIASDSKALEPDIFIFDEFWEGFDGVNSNSDVGFCGQEDGHKNQSDNSAGSLINLCCSPSKIFDMSSTCSLTLVDKGRSNELQLELEAIETQYQQCFRELVKMREEAIENAKRRWITRKKIPVM